MAGYLEDYSMSCNAALAYRCGEMPLSKWTKSAILERCGSRANALRVLTAAELKEELLVSCGWHHTSKYYNETAFFDIDDYSLEELTDERIAEIVRNRAPKKPKPKGARRLITAEVQYTVWEGHYRNYRRPKTYTETLQFLDGAKMVDTAHGGRKRLSSLTILKVLKEEEK